MEKFFLHTRDSNYVPIIVRLQHIYNLLFDLNQKLQTGRKKKELTKKINQFLLKTWPVTIIIFKVDFTKINEDKYLLSTAQSHADLLVFHNQGWPSS